MNKYLPLPKDETELLTFSDVPNPFSVFEPPVSKDESLKNKQSFLSRIKQNRINMIRENDIYCKNKELELLAGDLFYKNGLLDASIDYILSSIEANSSKQNSGRIPLTIDNSSEAPYIQALYKLRTEIFGDPILMNSQNFLNAWGDYVFRSFTRLTKALSEASAIPIRKKGDEYDTDDGMYLTTKDDQYLIVIWWKTIPSEVSRSNLWQFYNVGLFYGVGL